MISKASHPRSRATDGSDDFLEAIRAIVGESHLLVDESAVAEYGQNVSGLASTVEGVIRPADAGQVQQIVRACRVAGRTLYPISRGGNWGMGSRLPVQHGLVLDLQRMNRIREVDLVHGVAVVEPGVTQQQLYDHLESLHSKFFVDVTGSSASTSIIGNAAERGVGYFAQRAESLRNVEVVLGTGEVIRTGFGHFAVARCANLYPHGVGPDLTGLFLQSNFGVITCAAVELLPKTASHTALLASIDDEVHLARFVDRVAELRRMGLLRTAVHIGSRARLQSTVVPLIRQRLVGLGYRDAEIERETEAIVAAEVRAAWSAVCGIWGTRAEIAAIKRDVRRALRSVARVRFLTRSDVERGDKLLGRLSFVPALRRKHVYLSALKPVFGLTYGMPTEATMPSVEWSVGQLSNGRNPDLGSAGILYCLPIIPMEGVAVRELIAMIDETLTHGGFVPYVTFNMVNRQSLECVINIAFDRRDVEESERAHAAIDRLFERCMSEGLIPYRVGIQHMRRLVDVGDPHWQLVRKLKEVFDPDGVIAPGRYNLA